MTRPTERLSRAQARRVALAAQGFCDPPHARVTMATLRRAVGRTGVLQVDSVNVLRRAHYMPLYSRMGPYDTGLLHRAAERRPRRLVEYWAHVQALMPVDLWPVMRHRMADYGARGKWWADLPTPVVDGVRTEVARRGAVTASALDDGAPRAREHWGWNWSVSRRALDKLFMTGELAIAGRTASFEPVYDLPERVLPREVLEAPTPTREEADRELVRRAARSHGVGSAHCFRDYYRMGYLADARAAVETLREAGELLPVEVEGWERPAYLHAEARLPRRVDARTVLSPFDPVCWERARTEALFDFRYRIEIYTPPPRRVHGYYVLPFLLGDRLVGRVDLKADRAAGTLLAPGAFAEPGAPGETAAALAAELRRLSGWLGLGEVVVGRRGDLAGPLAAEVAAAPA